MTTDLVDNAARCPKCKTVKALSEWPRSRRTKSGRGSRCKACHTASVSEVRREKQRFIAKHKADTGCADCGERDPVVLDMDHRNPDDKDPRLRAKGGPARWKWGLTLLSWADLPIELGKCDVVCANCHRRRHASRI